MHLAPVSPASSYRLRFVAPALRLLPATMPGKTRLAKLALGPSLRQRDVLIRGRYDCTFRVPSLREPVGFYLAVDGVYEVEEVAFALSWLVPGSVFVDVGANVGAFTLPAARKIGPSGAVVAVEPSPGVFPYLEHNVRLNHLSNVRLVQCALLDRDTGSVPFYEAPTDHFGMGALAAQFNAKPIGVPAHTLDAVLCDADIRTVDLLKVDVEGFERDVFAGAEGLLTGDQPPRVLFEFCDWAEARRPRGQVGDAQRLLRGWGYRIWRLRDLLRRRPPLENVLTRGFETLVAMRDER